MKHYTYIVLLLLFTKSLSAQEYEKDKKFINEVVSHKGKMVVCSHLNKYTIENIRSHFISDTIQYHAGDAKKLILTNVELKYIHRQLNKMNKPYLKSDLFDSTQIIPQLSIQKLFKKHVDDVWEAFYNQYSPKGYYVFSKPIFLRKNSLCIFYSGNSCGDLCGYGSLYIYEKTKNGWKPWLELSTWMS